MNEVTKHRGPDETCFWLDENISLGHNRLSIIDLSPKANQPMRDEREELIIVFNGEIYNFKELKKELEKKYNFKSQSDTEVILYAYKRYGAECLNKFNGIFAFAIWDVVKKELFLARDRMGIKPLYYFYDGRRFIFSSEIKAILEHDIKREISIEAFNLYFNVLYIPEPYTMFAGIKKLPSASYLKLDKNNKLSIVKYWEIKDFSNTNLSKKASEAKIQNLFKNSIKMQLISDRPVGVFLSGGIDSTAVLGAVSQCSEEKVKTFSVGFDVKKDQENKFNADFLLARQTAQFYHTDHHELMISAKDVKDNIEKIVWHLGEPNFNPTAAAQFLLSQVAKKDVAVVLGGDGGDELFGGYPRYYFSHLLSYYHLIPKSVQSSIKILLKKLNKDSLVKKLELGPNAERFLAFLSQKPSLISSIISNNVINLQTTGEYFSQKYFGGTTAYSSDFEKYFMNIDRQSWLVDESLFRTDTMTMAWGLEQRVPILDYHLVELANKIPTAWKFKIWNQISANFQGKSIWRDAIRDYLPIHILNEKKRGWFTPMAKWLRADLRDYVAEILSPSNLNFEFFNVEEVQKIWREHLSGKQYNLNIIWAIVMWQLWYNRFIKQ